MLKFRILGFLAAAFTLAVPPAARAQSWNFTDGAARTAGAPSISLGCGIGQNAAATFVLRVHGAPFEVASGQTRELEAQIDQATLGRAPFLSEGGDLTVLLPRAHPLTEAMQKGSSFRLRDAGGDGEVEVQLSGLTAAIAALTAHCASAAAAQPPAQQQAAAQQPAAQRPAPQQPAPQQPAPQPAAEPAPVAVPVDMPFTQQDVARRIALEAVRRAPALLDDESFVTSWRNATVQQAARASGNRQQRPQQVDRATAMAEGRAMLARDLAATPQGPFFIGWTFGHNLGSLVVTDQGLAPADGRRGAQASPELGVIENGLSYAGARGMRVRASSAFDAGSVRTSRAQAEQILAGAAQTELRVAVEITDVVVSGVGSGAPNIIASGVVRFVGLYPRKTSRPADQPAPGPFLDPARLIHAFAPLADAEPRPSLAGAAQRIGLDLTADGGAFIDGAGNPAVDTFIRLLGAREAGQAGPLPDAVRSAAFQSLATSLERDKAVHPSKLGGYGGGRSRLGFAPHVDEFEQAEMLARIDSVIWPRVLAALPALPVEGVAFAQASLGDYDMARRGFPIQASYNSLGLAAAGDFPALTALPDFLPATQEQAQALLAALGARDYAGSRTVQFMLRYRLDSVKPAPFEASEPPEVVIEPLDLTLHGRSTLGEGEDPASGRITRFDVAAYRGAPRPVASADQLAFWDEINAAPRSDATTLAAAALSVADDAPALAARLAETADAVRTADPSARDARLAQTAQALAAAPLPGEIVLDGEIYLGAYDAEAGAFVAEQLRLQNAAGALGVTSPSIAYVNQQAFIPLPATPEQAAAFQADAYGRTAVTIWMKPVLAMQDGKRNVLYAAVTRLVARTARTDATGLPAAYIDIRPPAYAPEAQAEALATAEAPEAVPFDAEYLDLMMVARFGAELNDATWARMLADRRLYELAAASLGQPPVWGAFFDDPARSLNPVEERNALARFRTWTEARAAALPETVYLRDHSGSVPSQLRCGSMNPPPRDGYASSVPATMAALLDAGDYTANAYKRQSFEQELGRTAYRLPLMEVAFHGRPSVKGNGARADQGTSACAQNYYSQGPDFAGAAHVDALVRVEGLFRAPLDRNQPLEIRHYGRIASSEFVPATAGEDAGRSLGTFDVTLAVDRTEMLPVTQPKPGEGIVFGTATTLDAERLAALQPPAPKALDVLGMAPGQPWDEARALAAARIADAVVIANDGPPTNFQMDATYQALGPSPTFAAFRNGDFLIARDGGEAIALVREAERDPTRVLAVGSHRRFAAGTVTQDALVGALLEKYGDRPQTEDDPSYYGPRPGVALAWGVMANCLPSMRGNVSADGAPQQDNAVNQIVRDVLQRFPAPSHQFNGREAMLLERCAPLVWASVGVDDKGVARMTVWSLDMALLAEIGQMEDLALSPDDEEGAKALKEQAADIDL